MKVILSTLLYLSLFLLFLSFWGFYTAIYPFKITSTLTPADFNISFEKISFKTKDGTTIKGWFIPSAKKNVKTLILLHGYPADKGNILPSRIFLHDHYNLLFIDFRFLGESAGSYSTAGRDEVLDLLGAIDYLHSRGIQEVGVWGLSLGGAVALMAATKTPAIKALVTEASYANLALLSYDYYRIPLLRYPLAWLTRLWAWIFLKYDIGSVSPEKAALELNIPTLLIHSRSDYVVPFKHALLLEKALKHNPKATILFFDDSLHGQPIVNHQKIIKDFFDKNI